MTRDLALGALLAGIALVAVVSCSGGDSGASTATPRVDAVARAPGVESAPQPAATQQARGRATAPASTVTPAPSTPAPAFDGFDLDLSEGAFWEYRWTYTDRSCAQGSGCRSDEDDGVFQVTLGKPRTVQGTPVYEVKVTGKSAVGLKDTDRDFAPRWRYLGVAGNRIVGSDGVRLTTLFDAGTGKWAGSGYFTDRFDPDELIVARRGNLTGSQEIAGWDGVRAGPWVYVGRAASQSQCEMIEGLRICPNEDTFSFTEAEYYRPGVGPLAYNWRNSASFSGGGFFSSYDSTEWVALIGSSLRGDAASPTPTPVPPTATPAPLPPRSVTLPAFGPADGSLPHDPDDMMIPDFSSGVSLAQGVVEATFENPAGPRWSYGFSFRQSEEETFHAVYVTSGGRWAHFARGGSLESQVELGGGSAPLRRAAGESNRLSVIFGATAGWLFVNDEFVAQLAVGRQDPARSPGDVRVLGAVGLGDETAGSATAFEGFTVRRLERVFGPRDFELTHAPGDGELAATQAGVNVRNGVIEVSFDNPRPTTRRDWTHVLLFRATDAKFHTFVVAGSGQWLYALGGDVMRGPVDASAIDVSAKGTNHLRVITNEGRAWFFVNGAHVGSANLAGGAPGGDVEAVAALDDGLEIAGAVTRVSRFEVWSFD